MRQGPTRPESEAASWIVRLARQVVAQDDISAFRLWREDPHNDEAFRRQQHVWRKATRLSLDPEVRRALDGARGRRRRRRDFIRTGALAGAATALVSAAVLVFVRVQPETYATSIGERSQVRLADGSSVALDADSRLTVSLGRRTRSVRLLRGQALFDVSHDPRRPFTVTAGGLQVTAVGTRFDVRKEMGDDARVTLLQGRIQVLAGRGRGGSKLALAPGQETSTRRPAVEAARVEDVVGWTSGRMIFRDQPLAEVVAESNRYSRRRLAVTPSPQLDRVRVTGSFLAGDSADVAQALAELYGLTVEPEPDGTLRLRSS